MNEKKSFLDYFFGFAHGIVLGLFSFGAFIAYCKAFGEPNSLVRFLLLASIGGLWFSILGILQRRGLTVFKLYTIIFNKLFKRKK